MANGSEDLLSVHQFLKKLKEEQNGKLLPSQYFTEVSKKQLDVDISKIVLPESQNPIQKFIHGDIFEYSVQLAAGTASLKDNPWKKFIELYPNIKPLVKKEYQCFMDKAGLSAWKIFNKNTKTLYSRNYKNIRYSFGFHIHNNTFPILTKKLEADIFVTSVPNIVCDIKYSTMKKESYERGYLVHAIVQVLIYSLALNLDPSTLQLRVLVFFSKTAEAVLYESKIHKDKNFVNRLYKQLKGKHTTNERQSRTQNKQFAEDDELSQSTNGKRTTKYSRQVSFNPNLDLIEDKEIELSSEFDPMRSSSILSYGELTDDDEMITPLDAVQTRMDNQWIIFLVVVLIIAGIIKMMSNI